MYSCMTCVLADIINSVVAQQDPSDDILEELSRVHSTLRSYAQLNSRPSVSFAEHSADSPFPVQAFLPQMEFTEDGNLRVIYISETDHSQLGRTAFFMLSLETMYMNRHSLASLLGHLGSKRLGPPFAFRTALKLQHLQQSFGKIPQSFCSLLRSSIMQLLQMCGPCRYDVNLPFSNIPKVNYRD